MRIAGGERIRTVACVVARRPPPSGPKLDGGRRRSRDRSLRQHRLDGRLLALHAAPRRRRRQRRAAGGLRSAARVGRVLVQGRVPDGLRLRAGLRVPAGAARRAGDRLPREGLRLVPRADARSAQPARARVDGTHSGRHGRRARRVARIRRRRAVVPAGRGRHRGVSRHGATAHVAAAPRTARRLHRPRGRERARLDAREGRRSGGHDGEGHAAADAGARPAARVRAGQSRASRRACSTRRDVRDDERRRSLRRARALRLLDVGRRRLLPARAARRLRHSSATIRS